jgi:hypothetical protein
VNALARLSNSIAQLEIFKKLLSNWLNIFRLVSNKLNNTIILFNQKTLVICVYFESFSYLFVFKIIYFTIQLFEVLFNLNESYRKFSQLFLFTKS